MATATARSPRNDLASIKLRVSQKRGAQQPQTHPHLFPTTERTDISPASHKHSGAWKAVRQRTDYSFFNTDWNGLNGLDGWDLFPFPRLTPLQPGSDVHPCKRACLPEPPHPSGLPIGRRKGNKSRMFPRGHGIRQIASQWFSEDMCVIRDDCTLMMSCQRQDMCESVRGKCQDGS